MAEYTGHIRILRADNEFLGAADIMPADHDQVGKPAADVCFVIAGATFDESRKVGGSTKKNVLAVRLETPSGQPCKKQWIINKTCANEIAAMYGAMIGAWRGQAVWLYVDLKCRNPSGGTIAGIRVRPGRTERPRAATQQQQQTHGNGDAAEPAEGGE